MKEQKELKQLKHQLDLKQQDELKQQKRLEQQKKGQEEKLCLRLSKTNRKYIYHLSQRDAQNPYNWKISLNTS